MLITSSALEDPSVLIPIPELNLLYQLASARREVLCDDRKSRSSAVKPMTATEAELGIWATPSPPSLMTVKTARSACFESASRSWGIVSEEGFRRLSPSLQAMSPLPSHRSTSHLSISREITMESTSTKRKVCPRPYSPGFSLGSCS